MSLGITVPPGKTQTTSMLPQTPRLIKMDRRVLGLSMSKDAERSVKMRLTGSLNDLAT